jgi:hypothetical protein
LDDGVLADVLHRPRDHGEVAVDVDIDFDVSIYLDVLIDLDVEIIVGVVIELDVDVPVLLDIEEGKLEVERIVVAG